MRTVLLRNRINEEIDLSTEDYFATGLSNMGFEVKRTCGTVGNFRESSESVEISEFQSSVIICAWVSRKRTVQFTCAVLSEGPFELEFAFDGETMVRRCSLKSLSKTEIDPKTSLLTDTLELYFTSNWYSVKREKLIQRPNVVKTRGKVFPYKRSYIYTQNFREKKVYSNSIILYT